MKSQHIKDIQIFYEELSEDIQPENKKHFVFWGHGWGQSHQSFLAFAQALKNDAVHVVIDFPGFGKSPIPNAIWGTEEYAAAIAELIRAKTKHSITWVGHSFGCRIGVQLAARHPELIKNMVLIAGAGIPRKRPLWQKLYFKLRIYTFKAFKKLIPFGLPEKWLIKTFASADYQSAGPLRQIFVKVVNEDLTELSHTVKCPVILAYGSNDTETPPEIGERLSKIIPNSTYIELEGFDHYSILTDGRHQIVRLIKNLIQNEKN